MLNEKEIRESADALVESGTDREAAEREALEHAVSGEKYFVGYGWITVVDD
jgi:hypothetical protein